MAEIQKAITGALGAAAGAAIGVSEVKAKKEEREEAKALSEKHEKQKDLEHKKKVDLLDAKQTQIEKEEQRKDAVLSSKLKEAEIKQKGLLTAQGQEAEIRRAKLVEQRNKALTAQAKLELMRERAQDNLKAARDSRIKGIKSFSISDRLSRLQKTRRRAK